MRLFLRTITGMLVVLAWIGAIAVGMWWLAKYEHTPADAVANASAQWPIASALPREGAIPTVLLFVHPHCPCTASSASELARALTHASIKCHAIAVVYQPKEATADWGATRVMDAVRLVPGVTLVDDVDGREAALFGAKVSGEIMLYAADGVIRYQGGITGSRGHEGNNAARECFEKHLRNPRLPADQMPVFGCSLGAPAQETTS